jgi:hypothetical protein
VNRIAPLLNASKLNVMGLALAAIGMILEIASGSTLYPTLTGPIVLVCGAVLVTLWPGRWTSYVGLAIPLVLGVGLAVSAALSPDFLAQLGDFGNVGLVVGSVLHGLGLISAVSGGAVMVRRQGPISRSA